MSEDVIKTAEGLRVTLRPMRGQFALDPQLAELVMGRNQAPWAKGPGPRRNEVPSRYLRIPDDAPAERAGKADPEQSSRTLRILRMAFGPRPPLVAPVSENAVAAGVAELIETRYRMRPSGETLANRPITDIARTAIEAAAPFIQRDTLARVTGDLMWRNAWWLIGQLCAAIAFGVAGVYAIADRAVVIVGLLCWAGVMMLASAWRVATFNRRELGRTGRMLARQDADEPEDLDEAGR